MSSLRKFPLFPLLPKELRLLIWESTFTPRLLSLHYYTDLKSWEIPLEIGTFFRTPSIRSKIQILIYKWLVTRFRLNLASVDPISTSSVCHESRECVLRSGYRTWTLHNQEGHKREVFWNPIFDTVAFVGPYHNLPEPGNPWFPEHLIKFLDMQHPSQAKEIRKMALPTTSWNGDHDDHIKQIDLLCSYKNLIEFVYVLDGAGESKWVEWLISTNNHYTYWVGRWQACRFKLPEDIEVSWEEYKKDEPVELRNIPAIRVVREASEILGQGSAKMVLRCLPCPDLVMVPEGL